jgi:hypothetical protein
MGPTSKSFLTNQTFCPCADFRPLYNPISFPAKIQNPFVTAGSRAIIVNNDIDLNSDFSLVTRLYINVINFIESNYGQNSANRDYHLIPPDYQTFASYFSQIDQVIDNVSDNNMITFVNAVKQLLITAYNSTSLHRDNIVQQITISNLQNQLQDVLDNKNREIILNTCSTGTLGLTQNFTLAPVYNYYISAYGMPQFGQGFNPLKISYLADILESIDIDPYDDD